MSVSAFYYRFIIIFLSFFALTYQRPSPVADSDPNLLSDENKGPTSNPDLDLDNVIPNRYIVVYKEDASASAIEAHQKMIANEVEERINKREDNVQVLAPNLKTISFQGWRGMCLDAEDSVMMKIKNSPEVAYIEADTKFSTLDLVVQDKAPIGLARLSHTELNKRKSSKYVFDDSANGEGVVVYVVDTGIRTTHEEFEGRAEMRANFVDDVNDDKNGHGSHVAGTIAGKNFGVAKKARLVGVKVLDDKGKGSNSLVIEGLNFVASDIEKNGLAGKAIVNISIGGRKSDALNSAIESLTQDGVTVVVAAGNSHKDVVNFSPASALAAITVGAIDAANDKPAKFSNFGDEIDIFAPGVKVKSVGVANDSATNVLSGTSMAAPHVSGLAAYLISTEKDLNTHEKVFLRILELAKSTDAKTQNGEKGTTRLIAYNGSGR